MFVNYYPYPFTTLLMEKFFVDAWGVSPQVFSLVILPLLIFLARISDVTLSTIRIIFVMSGKRNLAPVLGFFEALIWLIAISQIIQNIGSPASYIAYAGGFAAGTFVGMYIEEKLAIGKVIVRVITRREATDLLEYLKNSRFGFTNVDAEGKRGNVNLIFTVVQRHDLPELIGIIKRFNPNAFYTIENVKYANELTDIALTRERESGLRRLVTGMKRR
jgi:uncharacterized protein YebE (UPF0316 family)